MLARRAAQRAASAVSRSAEGARSVHLDLGPTGAQAAALDALKPGQFGHVGINPAAEGKDPAKCPSVGSNEYLLVSPEARSEAFRL